MKRLITPERDEKPTVTTRSPLAPCPDCSNPCSASAESCPQCGRFFQRFAQTVIVDRKGWASTIAVGVLLAELIPILFVILLLLALFLTGVGFSALSGPHR